MAYRTSFEMDGRPRNRALMRILVISDMPQFVTGGAETQAYRLVCAWKSAGHDVIVAGRRMRSGSIRLDDGSTIRVKRIHTLQRLGRVVRAATYALSLSVLLLRNSRHIDLFYARFLNEGAAVSAFLKRLGWLRQPLVAVPANVRGVGDVNTLQRLPGSRRIIRLLTEQCDAINLIAGAMVRELSEAGFDSRRFTHIPNGISLSDRPCRFPSVPATILTVGRLTPQKGIDILIQALALLRDQIAPGVLRIAGDGPERDRLQIMARDMRVDHAIVWLGELSPEAVAHELDSADIFLLASRYEGMSNAGLEAMERGKAMLVTRCGGLDEYVTEGHGWVVEAEDPEALASAISQALNTDSSTLSAMGVANRALVKERFDMKVVSTHYLDLFHRLIDPHGN